MSSQELGWWPLLNSDGSSAAKLKGALLTTYDRADERLLAEHLLPLWLNLNRDPESTGVERQYFLISPTS